MNSKAMVVAAFAADALALGGHWVYNAPVIEKKYGRLDRYENPLGRSYHPTKEKGAFTHYGDQMLLLLEEITGTSGFDPVHFATTWRNFFLTYDGYYDKASKTTLENIKNGVAFEHSGSTSTDLAGAARISPLIYYCHLTGSDVFSPVRLQTAMTHNHPDVVESAAFFADVSLRVLGGQTPTAAVDETVDSNKCPEQMAEWVRRGKASREHDTRETIASFGQQCETEAAFPGVIHLIYKYENDLENALVENVMAGGDSAARGMITGMVLGAHNSMGAIPSHWLSEMKAYSRIKDLLEKIDHL